MVQNDFGHKADSFLSFFTPLNPQNNTCTDPLTVNKRRSTEIQFYPHRESTTCHHHLIHRNTPKPECHNQARSLNLPYSFWTIHQTTSPKMKPPMRTIRLAAAPQLPPLHISMLRRLQLYRMLIKYKSKMSASCAEGLADVVALEALLSLSTRPLGIVPPRLPHLPLLSISHTQPKLLLPRLSTSPRSRNPES